MRRFLPVALRRPAPHLLGLGVGLLPFLAQPLLVHFAEALEPGAWSRAGFLVSVLRAPGQWIQEWIPLASFPAGAPGPESPPSLVRQGLLQAGIVGSNLVGWWGTVAASVLLGSRFGRERRSRAAHGREADPPASLS